MNVWTVAVAVALCSVVLVLLSWKWCLPINKTIPIIGLGAVVAFLFGMKLQQLDYSWWIIWGVIGLVQVAVYVGIILWLFFRDPDRKVPSDPRAVLSPADGIIVYIRRLEAGEPLRPEKNRAVMTLTELGDSELARQALWQIGISMVFTDVHVNRSPIGGQIMLVSHRAGQFLSLRRQEALNLNERQTLLIVGQGTHVGLVQIASRLVRRIVAYVSEGQTVEPGQRVGMIKFGSQVDLFLPVAQAPSLKVSAQQRVTAGETIICRLQE
jgi:phosphatidylserine decarboxylase